MNHALLLRLFLSSSFFSVHVALQYLRLYADNVGISHYLTTRLRGFALEELIDVWGFIWYVLSAGSGHLQHAEHLVPKSSLNHETEPVRSPRNVCARDRRALYACCHARELAVHSPWTQAQANSG